MELVSSAENSSLDWRGQYAYIEDIGDGRGYTGGIIGFTSGTHDMLELVKRYTADCPSNPLAGFIGALESVDGTDSHSGLGPKFIAAWKQAAKDPLFQNAQNDLRDSMYFHPAVTQAKEDGLGPLGQFIYYDAYVNHGPGNDRIACDAIPTGQKLAGLSFPGIRQIAMCRTRTPAQGGDEVKYLNAFLDARKARIQAERPDNKASRVEDMQRVFLNERNLDLHGTLRWSTYGDQYQYKN
ncbi:MAG: chitosanase [Patescibacteria group bacterium]|nr:chitosanase [Patescibacteria group bacterium]